MTQPRPTSSPSKPIHEPPQRRLCLLRPRRQLLRLCLSLQITTLTTRSHHATLLSSLRPSEPSLMSRRRRPIHRHLHALLVLLRLPWWRKVLRRRIGVVLWWGLHVLWLAWLAVVWVRLCVEAEVVLGDLAVASAFRVGDEELWKYMLAHVHGLERRVSGTYPVVCQQRLSRLQSPLRMYISANEPPEEKRKE